MGFAIGGAVLGGALLSANASQNAASTEAGAAGQATALDQSMFNTEQANAAPYLASGTAALNTLNADMPSLTAPFTMQDFQQAPGYQFQLNQGLQAMQRSAAAKGMLNSVGTQQNLNNYAQGSANQDYQQALQNYMGQNQQTYNMLMGQSQQGLQATGMSNAAAQGFASTASGNMIGAANAQAAGQVGTANAISSGIGTGVNAYQSNNLLQQLQQQQFQNGAYGSAPLTMPQLGSSSASASPQYGIGGTGTLGATDF